MTAVSEWLALLKTRQELEKMLFAALDEFVGGKTVTSWSVGDSSAEKQQWLHLSPRQRIEEIGAALISQGYYTADQIEKLLPITRTRIAFS